MISEWSRLGFGGSRIIANTPLSNPFRPSIKPKLNEIFNKNLWNNQIKSDHDETFTPSLYDTTEKQVTTSYSAGEKPELF